jgi:uncharacterized protein
MADLKSRITESMKDCMKTGRKVDLGVIRLIQAAIKQREVDERIELGDAEILRELDKMIRQRRDSVKQFAAANRQDLADKETAEIEIIQTFMPTALSPEEVETLLNKAIAEVQPKSIQDMAKIMSILKPQLLGRADMAQVGLLVKEKLTALSG